MDDKTTIYHILVFVYRKFSVFDGMVHISHDSQFQGFICAYLLKPQLLSFFESNRSCKTSITNDEMTRASVHVYILKTVLGKWLLLAAI